LKVRHVRATRGAAEQLAAIADELVDPKGAIDELFTDGDLVAACRVAERALGKYQRAGSST
jgi:hypothetical protein